MNGFCDNPLVYSSWQKLFLTNKHINIRNVLESLDFHGRAEVLDIGCGTGQDACLFTDKSLYTYVGTDVSKSYIEKAQINFPDLKFIAANVTHDDLKIEADVVLVDSVLHHIDDNEMDSFLLGVLKHLKPNGCLVLQDMYRTGMLLPLLMMKLDRGRNGKSLPELERLLGRYFTIEATQQYKLKVCGLTLYNMALLLCKRR